MAGALEDKVDLKLKVLALLLPTFFALLQPPPLHAATYYVDALHGNDSFPGTSMEYAWKSIKKINNSTFSPGDTILFKRGARWHGSLVITSSGTAEQPIVLGAYGKEGAPLPLISGFSDGPLKWSRASGNIYKTTASFLKDHRPSLLVYNNISRPPIYSLSFPKGDTSLPAAGSILLQTEGTYRAMWVTSCRDNILSGYAQKPLVPGIAVHVRTTDPATGKERNIRGHLRPPLNVIFPQGLENPGEWLIDTHSQTLFLCSNLPPQETEIRISKERHGIRVVSCSNVCIEDISIEGFSETGIYLHDSFHIKISNVYIKHIGASGHRSGILLFNSRECQISSCSVKSALGNGIALYACNYAGKSARTGSCRNIVTGCTVDITGAAGISLSTDSKQTAMLVQDNIIEKNRVSRANSFFYDAAGIYLLFTSGNIIQGNWVGNCGNMILRSSGIMLDTGCDSTVVKRNRLLGNSLCGIAITGNHHTIKENIIEKNGTDTFDAAQVVIFPAHQNATGCSVTRNRIMAEEGQGLVIYTSTGSRPTPDNLLDFNSYQAAAPSAFCFSLTPSCKKWTDFSNWKRQTGQDRNSAFSFLSRPKP